MNPTISIITPCYNPAATLAETIASVRAQALGSWEMICVDDGSTDDTPQLLRQFAAEDSRVQWFSSENSGQGAARNRGIERARGERIFFLDADDLITPDALPSLLALSEDVGPGCIVTAGWELLDEQARALGVFRFPSVPGEPFDALLRANRLQPMALVPRALLGRRPFVEDRACQGCEDWELWLRLAHAGARFVGLPRVLLRYRLRAASASHQCDRMFAAGRHVLERWMPHAADPAAVADVRHRWAVSCGALALAGGDPDALNRYFAELPPLEPAADFATAAANNIDWGLQSAYGVRGETLAAQAEALTPQVRAWLDAGPLSHHAADILSALRYLLHPPAERLKRLAALLQAQPGVWRLVIYGLGTHGLTLLQYLRAERRFQRCDIHIADDYADPVALEYVGLVTCDPRRWTIWPTGTFAVITAADHTAMRRTLERAGGRPEIDFTVLAQRPAAAPVAAGAPAAASPAR